jgi:hypothetical protein
MAGGAAPSPEELSAAMKQVVLSATNQRQAERTLVACNQPSTPDNIKFVLAVKHLSALQERRGGKGYRLSAGLFSTWKSMVSSSVEREQAAWLVPRTNMVRIPPEYQEYIIDVSGWPELPMNFDPALEVLYDRRASPQMLCPNVEKIRWKVSKLWWADLHKDMLVAVQL